MKIYDIYTDGSHLKHKSGRLGIGGVLVCNDKLVSSFSQELSLNYMKFAYQVSDPSNPTAELMAVLVALRTFGKEIKNLQGQVIIHADYMGVKAWMTDEWKVKEPYIQKIKDEIKEEIKRLGLGGKVSYEWVHGHSGDKWNEYTDKLAKGELKK